MARSCMQISSHGSLAVFALACCSMDAVALAQTTQTLQITGRASYEDGSPLESGNFQLQLIFVLDPTAVSRCVPSPSKKQASALTQGKITANGEYSVSFDGGQIKQVTHPSCSLDGFILDEIDGLRIVASIEASPESCERFCKANVGEAEGSEEKTRENPEENEAAFLSSCLASCLESGRLLAGQRLSKSELLTIGRSSDDGGGEGEERNRGESGEGEQPGRLELPVDLTFDEIAPTRSRALLPDLRILPESAENSIQIVFRDVSEGSCALEEKCVGGPGLRRLLIFDTEVFNAGGADFEIGSPESNSSLFDYAECHGHYHLGEMMTYELLRSSSQGPDVAMGSKLGFCMMDSVQVSGAKPGRFTCEDQGISSGWSDVYDRSLDCQWVDITDVPPGDYELRLTVNPERRFLEADYANNTVSIPVSIPPAEAR